MNKYKLTKRDSRYYYFNNENGEVLKSPTHCYDADKICMPNHKRDKDGYLCLGQYVSLHIENRGDRIYVFPSHEVYDYLPAKRSNIGFRQTPRTNLVQELKRRIYSNCDTYSPSKLWEMHKFICEAYDHSDQAVMHLAQIAGETLLPDESETVEYKSCEYELNKPEILIAVGAMANHCGGTITLGVADSKRVVGCEAVIEKYDSMDKFSGMLRNLIKQSTNTNLYLDIEIEFEQSGSHTLCHIHVPRSSDIVLVKNVLYVRSGNTSQRLVGDRMLDYIRNR